MKKRFLKAVALSAVLALSTANIAFAAGGSIGHGNLSVYKEGKLVSKLTGQNPIEDGALLVCDGKCMIKSEGISLITANDANVAVTNEENTFRLYVKEGRVDYIISSNVRTIAFHTPQGTYTVAEVVFNAGKQSAVKGTVVVDSTGHTEISVTEGRMVFATADGMKTVDANQKIVLAVTPAAGAGATGALVATGAALVAGVVLAIDSQNNTDGGTGTGADSTPPADISPPAQAPARPLPSPDPASPSR